MPYPKCFFSMLQFNFSWYISIQVIKTVHVLALLKEEKGSSPEQEAAVVLSLFSALYYKNKSSLATLISAESPHLAESTHFRRATQVFWQCISEGEKQCGESFEEDKDVPQRTRQLIMVNPAWPSCHGPLATGQLAVANMLRDNSLWDNSTR